MVSSVGYAMLCTNNIHDSTPGLTNTNYAELVELYSKYSSRGLEILAFPCNTFLQERGSDEDIKKFALHIERGI